MTNLTPRDQQNFDRKLLQENIAMREQNIAMREQNRAIRENDGVATGLMLGILLLGAAALGVGVYFLNQKPTVTPTRTIIEREHTNTTLPAQPSSPPNVNVTVPNPAPPAPPNVTIAVPNSAPNAAPSSTSTAEPPSAAPSAPSSTSNAAPQSNSSNTAPQAAPANP